MKIIKSTEKKNIVPFMGLILVIILFEILSGGKLFNSRNVTTIINEVFILMMGASALVFLMAQGNLDLSIMANAAIACTVGVKAASISPYLALPVCLCCGIAIGLLNGLLHTRGKIDSFITTIGMSFVLSGLVVVILGNKGSLAAPMEMLKWNSTELRIITLIVFGVSGYILFEFTSLGKYCKAIGSCQEAARQSGVNVDRVKVIAFMMTGGMAGVLAFYSIIRTGTAAASVASSTMFNILIAVLMGGVSITGGASSKFRAAILGSFTMAFMSVGMTICEIDTTIQQLIRGIIFIGIVTVTYDRKGIVIIR